MESKIELIETIGKIVVFLMILLSFFLFTVKTKNRRSNTIFGIYLLVIAFDFIGFFTLKTLEYPIIQHLKESSTLAQLPLFYLYVLSACYSDFKFTKKHFVHFILFFLFFILLTVTSCSDLIYTLYRIIGEVQYFAYIIAIVVMLKKYKTVYLENYSNANYSIYRWLFQITVLSCIAHTFVLLRWYLSESDFHEYIQNINIVISISVLVVTIFIVLKALYRPELFTGVNLNLKPVKSLIEKTTSSNAINVEGADYKYLEKITRVMEQDKPYLDFGLTLQKLAVQSNIPEKELSLLINHHLNKHFFDFINEYRINDAKKILQDPTKKDLTVLEILYSVGFNSKSSFYTAFKKLTSKTPVEYRKSKR